MCYYTCYDGTLPFLFLLLPLLQFFQVFLGKFDDVRGFLFGGQSSREGARASVQRLPVGGAGQVFPQVLVHRLAFQQFGSAGGKPRATFDISSLMSWCHFRGNGEKSFT